MNIFSNMAKSRILVVVLLGLVVGVGAYFALRQQVGLSLPNGYVASRPADSGCTWTKEYRNTQLGIEFVYEDCGANKDSSSVTFEQNGNKIHAIYDDGVVAPVLLELFRRPLGDTDEQAVLAIAGKNFTSYQKAHCVVELSDVFDARYGDNMIHFLDSSKKGYVVVPDAQYQKKIATETLPGDIPDAGCGSYGFYADALAYFEFHPSESKSTFVYVGPMQDAPPFDEQSIRFTK